MGEHWDEEWGEPEDYNVVEGKEELDGFKIGDTVYMVEDGESGGFEGDAGKVVGISHTGAGLFGPARDELVVFVEDYGEPMNLPPRIVAAL